MDISLRKKSHVSEIKRLIQERRASPYSVASLSRFLISKGIERELAEEISTEFSHSHGEFLALSEIIAKRIIPVKSLRKKIALIGTSGVGKTTAALKLAIQFLEENEKPKFLSLDPRGLKNSEMQTLKQKNIPIYEKKIVEKTEALIVDTPPCNLYDQKEIDHLGESLADLGDLDFLLVLSATHKDVDLYGAIYQFSPLPIKGILFTKLDETLALGSILNLSQKTDLPIYYTSHGKESVLQQADPYMITHHILTNLNQEDFQNLRQMAIN